MTSETIKEALKQVKYPGYSRDIMSFGLVKDISAENDAVAVVIELTGGSAEVAQEIKAQAEAQIRSLPDVKHVYVDVKDLSANRPAQASQASRAVGSSPNRVQGIKQVIAVASGKGGVGKSTVSANLACALTHLGLKIGLLDCDIYGPSIPLMMGVKERPSLSPNEKLLPLKNHDVKLMSMGFLLEDDQPVIWRGPMIMKTIQQFITSVEWGELDILLVDLPPGTGDAQLSLCQTVPLDGGVVVTTPQEASLGVVRKGIAMFRKVNVPILGIVENMSYFTTPQGERIEIFGSGGGQSESQRQDTTFLGKVPIFQEIREGGDAGVPVVAKAPESAPGEAFLSIAKSVQAELAKL
ncbi:MAG: Iron-sulfur cluster carrier protein [Verrucomicrobia subdivision 3 bacterium]|nr:Iron-sulfur cluster carrier protein [Limisphaerales bacterium]MCS1412809.1 Iron-sulfur cluster carrier protein [Limisphaerales bacterium]